MMSSSQFASIEKSLSLKNLKFPEPCKISVKVSSVLPAICGHELSKANSDSCSFTVGREVGLGKDWKFIDSVFSYIDEDDTKNLIFVQIKYKQGDFQIDSQVLSAEATKAEDDMSRDFNIQQYFMSYLSVREELKHAEEISKELRKGKIKYIAIFTNIAFNFEDLNNNGFRLEAAPHDITNLFSLNKSLPVTEGFDHCYQLADISEDLRKILKKSSDLHRLAKELAQYVVWEEYRENKIMEIDETPIKYYHVALEREVIQKSDQDKNEFEIESLEKQLENKQYCEAQFRGDFLENDEPGPRQTLRDTIFEIVREMDESMKDASDDELKSLLSQVKWKLAVNFGKTKQSTKDNLPCEWMTVKEEDIADFLKCLVFIVNKPRITELEDLSQASVMYDAVLRQIIGKLGDMQKRKDVVNDAVTILINLAIAVTQTYEHEINQYGKFSKLENSRDLSRFLLSSNQILCITTSVTLLSSIKILQSLDGICIYGTTHRRISVDLDILKSKIIRKSIVKSFELEKNNLLIIECRHSVDEQDIEEFYYKLSKVVRENSKKKIILIVQQEGHNILSVKFEKDFQNTEQFVAIKDSIDLNDFVPIEEPLKKKLIVFQGQKQRVSLAELIGIEDFHSQGQRDSEIIDVTTLITILNNDEIEIGSKPRGTSNLPGAYVTLFQEVNTGTLAYKLSSKQSYYDNEEIYIMSGISGSNKQEKIKKLIKCLGLKKAKKEIIEEQLGDIGSDSKIQLADDQFEDEDFKAICHRHSEKKVFWIDIDDKQKFILQKFYNPNFYLKRKFKNVIIKNEVKELLMDDNLAEIFIFSPVNDVENFCVLLGLTDEKEKRNVENNYKHSKSSPIKIFISEEAAVAEFIKLCRENQTVHRLKFEENKLVWCDSHGSVNNLRNFIDHKESETFLIEEDNLIKEIKNKKVVIIADDPCTGKTTTLTKLYESKYQSTSFIETHWIVEINIMESLQAIRDIKFSDGCIDIASVVNFMSRVDVKLNNNLAKSLLRIALDKTKTFLKPILIVLDGFDEILDEVERNKVVSLLKFLKNETAAKLWITTRLHLKKFLENELSTFAIQFNPMIRDNQFTYIKMYLKDRLRLILNVDTFDELFADSGKMATVIQKFSEAFLNKMISVFKMKILNFIGTPLQLHLMLKSSIMPFKCSIENDTEDYQNFNYLGDDAWEVHKNFVKRKYEAYFDKADIRESVRKREEKFLLNLYCKELAISLIFKLEPKNTLKAFQDKALSTGIITFRRSNIEFIHTSFRDYFASKVFIYWMKEKPNELSSTNKQEYILKEILKQTDFQLIRTFINIKLKKMAKSDLLEEITQQYEEIIKKLIMEKQSPFSDEEETVLHIAIKERNLYIASFLLNSLKRHKDVLKEFLFKCNDRKETSLHLACNKKVSEVVRILLEAAAGISEDAKEHKTCLKDFIFMCDKNGETALHLACREGAGEVVRILLETAAGISEDVKEHKTCLKEFIFMRDKNGETALHLACREGTGEVVGILLEAAEGISEDTQEHKSVLKEFIFVYNVFGKTALHHAYGGVIDVIVRIFLEAVGISEVTLFSLCLKSLKQKH